MPKRLLYLILISTALRMIIASVLELSNDEVYYYLYALDLQPNYFDHPPGVGILIRIFTFNLNLHHELFIRLGAIVCAALGTTLSYRLGKLIKNEQTGWFAAILYTTGIYTSVIAGTFIIPDSPQVVFWLGALVVMYEIILRTDQQQLVSLQHWLLFGLLTGLCVLCKVHGIFLWLGFGIYILFYQRELLKNYRLYLAVLLTLMVISPIAWWNFQNDFITYRFHSERIAVKESLLHFDYFFQAIGGQLLYNNPINAVLILVSFWKLRSMNYLNPMGVRFIIVNGLPIILIVTGMSLFNSMLPHWSGPGFLVLSFLAAAWLDEKSERKPTSKFPVVMKASLSLISVAALIAVLLINFYPGTLGSKNPERYGDGDFTLDMYGWEKFSTEFGPWLEGQKADLQLPSNIKIISDKWFPAAHIDFYVASQIDMKVIGVGQVTDLHQYYWLNGFRPALKKGENALCIIPTNDPSNMENSYLRYFSSATILKTFESRRGGELTRYFEVYLLKDYNMNDEMHIR